LNSLVSRIYRGHLYGRKPRRKLKAERDGSTWGEEEWKLAVLNSGDPRRWFGYWEEYILSGSVDVTYYRESWNNVYMWQQPEEWKQQDRADFNEREHARTHGFTATEVRAATWLQKAWRGVTARTRFKYVMKAQNICKGAEEAYLKNPGDIRCTTNYVLFIHTMRKDYARARILYSDAISAMEARGPDTQLLLYAFAIFCFVTEEDSLPSIFALVERANVAQDDRRRSLLPPDATSGRRNPKRFALAEAGFFRFAAYHLGDAESWHNYAACRHLVYADFDGASECYQRAVELEPKNIRIQNNFQVLLDMFPDLSNESSSFETISIEHQAQA
ncbi:unnamed protein product, partial [Choristocarpus tenellus]